MFLTATIRDDNGESLGVIVLASKEFRSGSVGYHGQGKVEIAGKRHQVQVQAVEIGSKAKGDSGEAEAAGMAKPDEG